MLSFGLLLNFKYLKVEAINPLANTLGSVPQASVPISAESYKNTGELKLQEMPIYGQKNENKIVAEGGKRKKKKNKNKKIKQTFSDPNNKYSVLSELNEEEEKKVLDKGNESKSKGKEILLEEGCEECNGICDEEEGRHQGSRRSDSRFPKIKNSRRFLAREFTIQENREFVPVDMDPKYWIPKNGRQGFPKKKSGSLVDIESDLSIT